MGAVEAGLAIEGEEKVEAVGAVMIVLDLVIMAMMAQVGLLVFFDCSGKYTSGIMPGSCMLELPQ